MALNDELVELLWERFGDPAVEIRMSSKTLDQLREELASPLGACVFMGVPVTVDESLGDRIEVH